MQLNMGDVPGWTALGVAIIAVIVSVRANRHAKDSADASKDSAGSARRSADAAERQAAAAEKALPPPPPAVDWEIEHLSNEGYMLRNIGVGTATGVKIDLERAGIIRDLDLGDGTVPRRGTLRFLLSPTLARMSLPSELWVSWDGQSVPVAVPVPRPR
jgi:hypothetical protein